MVNLTLNEKYFFEECREPRLYFIYSQKQNNTLQLFGAFLGVYYTVSGYYWWLNRHQFRLRMRINAVFFAGLLIFPLKLFAAYIYSVSEPYFFNTCFFDKLTFTLTQLLLVFPIGIRIYLYILQYKLHNIICDGSHLTKTFKIAKIKQQLSSKSINQVALVVLVISLCLSLLASLVFCPIIKGVSVCGNYGKGNRIYTLISVFVVIYLVIIVCFSIYLTLKYPDPFGILNEAVGVNVLYVMILYTYLKGVRDLSGPFGTSYYVGSLLVHAFLCLLFTIMVPLQVYLSKRRSSKHLSLDDVLRIPNALKTFRVFTEKIYTVEHLDFYLEALQFREDYSLLLAHKNESRAKLLYEKYIAVQAPDRINLSDDELSPFVKVFENDCYAVKKESFDDLIKGVYSLLKLDSYARFIKSDIYNLYAGLSDN